MSKCDHGHIREIETRGFSGPVNRDENRAAHGNVCIHEECVACGARRRRNVNCWHEEIGPWGPDRDRRRETLRAARLAVPAAPAAITMVCGDVEVGVTLDHEGMIVTSPTLPAREGEAVLSALPAAFVAAAKATRRGVLAVQRAVADEEGR